MKYERGGSVHPDLPTLVDPIAAQFGKYNPEKEEQYRQQILDLLQRRIFGPNFWVLEEGDAEAIFAEIERIRGGK